MESAAIDAPPLRAFVHIRGRITTTVRLVLFDKHMNLPFEGLGHLLAATEFVGDWNAHFEQAWMEVRETSAHIMRVFTEALGAGGVGEEPIGKAMEAVRQDAQA